MDADPTFDTAIREPRQGRSRASFERMMETAERLMSERGTDEFTLTEVSRVGKVSIGSIYCRFDSKDDLVRAVHRRILDRVDAEMAEVVARVRDGSGDLRTFVRGFVDGLSEGLLRFAPAMRPFMLRASSDEVVARLGKASYQRTATDVVSGFLMFRDEIAHPEPEHAVDASYRVVYASIARYLGFGSSDEFAREGDWDRLKVDLAGMVLAFLKSDPSAV